MLRKLIDTICGDPETFSIDQRVFHITSVSAIFAIIIFEVYYIFFGYPYNVLLLLLGLLASAIGSFVLSRFYGRFLFSKIIFYILILICLSALWFDSQGSYGTIADIYLVVAVLFTVVVDKHYILYTSVLLAALLLMFTLEIIYPEKIVPYTSLEIRYTDYYISYIIYFAVLVFSIRSLKKSYSKEKEKALERYRALIENQEKLNATNADLLKKNQLIQEQNEHLTALNEVQSKLFATLSHDLKGSLNRIGATLDLIQKGYVTAEETTMLVGNLSVEVKQTVEMLNNMLLWAKSYSNMVSPDKEHLFLDELLKQAIEQVSAQASDKNISLELGTPEKIRLYADRQMLLVVFRNLLTNAIKFSYQGSTVILKARLNNQWVKVEVIDHGKGMLPEQLDKLFKGAVVSENGTANEKGTGLGLSLSYEYIEQHQGKIEVQSQPEKGTAISVFLPVTAEG